MAGEGHQEGIREEKMLGLGRVFRRTRFSSKTCERAPRIRKAAGVVGMRGGGSGLAWRGGHFFFLP